MTVPIKEPNDQRDIQRLNHGQSQLLRRPQTGVDGGGMGGGGGEFAVCGACDFSFPTTLDILGLGGGGESDPDVLEVVGGTIVVKQKGIYVATLTASFGSIDGARVWLVIEWDIDVLQGGSTVIQDASYMEGAAAFGQDSFASVTGHQIVLQDLADAGGIPNVITPYGAVSSAMGADAQLLVTRIATLDQADIPGGWSCPE